MKRIMECQDQVTIIKILALQKTELFPIKWEQDNKEQTL